jgi:Tyrosine phosphatase family
MIRGVFRRVMARGWPWGVLALVAGVAAWHAVDFPDEVDAEFPRVVRPTFSRRPPPAYRLAEPGDTIDRVALYAAAAAVVLAALGRARARAAGERGGPWISALGLALGASWHAATPGPAFDGWHGLGWRALADPAAPSALRLALGIGAAGLAGLVAGPIVAARRRWIQGWRGGRGDGVIGLLAAAAVLVALRQVEIPGVEPVGYWPRWAFVLGVLAFDLALVKLICRVGETHQSDRWVSPTLPTTFGATAAWIALVAGGLGLIWYHRPIDRLRAIVPGRIFISGMPTRLGLEVAQRRHHFKTIVNLFPEDLPGLRSPLLDEELRFAREHGIAYVGNTARADRADAFLDRTLALARDPDAWPILVHCHACMDRTPAWWGIYRFVVAGEPLVRIMQEIERHRGSRPKASVTLLLNRVLEPRAPGRYARDPTAQLLKRCAAGTRDPFFAHERAEARRADGAAPPRVSRRDGGGEAVRRP